MTTLGLRDLGFVASQRGDPDPNFSSVSLLLHGDGTNGSTTIIDSSPSPKTVTAFGDAKISTAQSKFGGSSIAFDGSGDYLSLGNDSYLNLGQSRGPFTIELFFYQVSAGNATFIGKNGGSNDWSNTGWQYYLLIASGLIYWDFNSQINNDPALTGARITTTSPTAQQWHHLAVSYDGTTTRMFLNGSLAGSTTRSYVIPSSATMTYIGQSPAGGINLNGFIDEFRISSVARYTSNFTPPTAPFPDF